MGPAQLGITTLPCAPALRRWYFGENGWPASNVLGGRAPGNEEEQTLLIDTLQDWKTDKYKDIIGVWGDVVKAAGSWWKS